MEILFEILILFFPFSSLSVFTQTTNDETNYDQSTNTALPSSQKIDCVYDKLTLILNCIEQCSSNTINEFNSKMKKFLDNSDQNSNPDGNRSPVSTLTSSELHEMLRRIEVELKLQ